MPTLPGPSNAIAYAQFRLQGAWRGTGLLAGICLLVLGGLLGLQVLAAVSGGTPPAAVTRDWPQGLIALQGLFLLVIAPLRVTAAVRGDVNSRMLESHRLMPIPPAGAVAGYAAGGPWAALVLAAAAFAFGGGCALTGSAGQGGAFLLANAALAVASAAVCVVAVHLSLAGRFAPLLLVGLFVAAMMSGLELLPGVNVLTAPLIGRSALLLHERLFDPLAAVIATVAVTIIAAISFAAAVRLYRHPGAIGLSARLGLALLGTGVALSAAGLNWPETFGMRHRDTPALVQLIATLIALLLLAGLPLAASAKAAERSRRSADRPAAAVGPWATAAVAVVLIGGLPLLIPGLTRRFPEYLQDMLHYNDRPVSDAGVLALLDRATRYTPAVVAAAVLGLTFVFRLAYRRVERAWLIAFVWLLVAWVAPVVVDAVTTADPYGRPGPIATLSPIGALIELWAVPDAHPAAGIALQFAVAAVPAILYAVAIVRNRERVTAASSA